MEPARRGGRGQPAAADSGEEGGDHTAAAALRVRPGSPVDADDCARDLGLRAPGPFAAGGEERSDGRAVPAGRPRPARQPAIGSARDAGPAGVDPETGANHLTTT